MEKTVFMVFEEYIEVVNELRDETGFNIFVSYRMDEPFECCEKRVFISHESFGLYPQMKVIMGAKSDFVFKDQPQINVTRKDKVGFVRIGYGGDDERAIGATIFSGDKSENEKIIDRVLTKILKRVAIKGVRGAEGGVSYITDRYYWTKGALSSGKNWHLFLGQGVSKAKNSTPGYVPK